MVQKSGDHHLDINHVKKGINYSLLPQGGNCDNIQYHPI